MKAKKIIFLIIILAIIILAFMPKEAYAGDLLSDIWNTAKDWENYGASQGASIMPSQDLQDKFIPIGQVLISVATVVLIVVTGIMGIKYVTANPEEKGKLKQQLIGLVVSIVVIYGAVGIWTLVQNIIKEAKL